ncbi:hypothetical protein NDU88_007916 [Pleurodeles waltl]|uniref:Uncharacterized protein n=1 Tax=Pleurodeles waltl TaxID=8319 RepID=A0AAV7QT25_PLEWA|nr:hypothetical protein NDU88_007916 [Pleurodeles waltl]
MAADCPRASQGKGPPDLRHHQEGTSRGGPTQSLPRPDSHGGPQVPIVSPASTHQRTVLQCPATSGVPPLQPPIRRPPPPCQAAAAGQVNTDSLLRGIPHGPQAGRRPPQRVPVSQVSAPPVPGPRPPEVRRGPRPQSQPASDPAPGRNTSHTRYGRRRFHRAPVSWVPLQIVLGSPGSAALSLQVTALSSRRVGSEQPTTEPSSASSPHLGRPPDRILVIWITGSSVVWWLCCTPRNRRTSARQQPRHGMDGST